MRRRGAALVLAVAVAVAGAAGCKRSRYADGPPAPVVDAEPPPRVIADGAASKDEVWARAAAAWQARDYETVAHCIAPATRTAWLNTLLTMSFFATMGHVGSGDPLGELSAVLRRSGADFTVEERLSGIDLETLPQTLLARVRDPAGLLAGIIAWGAKYGVATDPARGMKAPEKLVVAPVEPGKGIVDTLAEAPTTGLQVNIEGPPGLTRVLTRLATGGPPPADQRYSEDGGVWYLEE